MKGGSKHRSINPPSSSKGHIEIANTIITSGAEIATNEDHVANCYQRQL